MRIYFKLPRSSLFLLPLILIVVFFILQDRRNPWFIPTLLDHAHRNRHRPLTEEPIHILFTFVDHFEPPNRGALDRWIEGYPRMVQGIRDSCGLPPRHTWFWFFPLANEQEVFEYLRDLGNLVYQGFGEIEFHFHHEDDTPESWDNKVNSLLEQSHRAGAMITAETRPTTRFAFIHGLWALDNSRGGKGCGVNNELLLLNRAGCYADFTHPSWGMMQPRTVNRFYYVKDDPDKPKSYDRGVPMRVGGEEEGDLLLMLGPSCLGWRGIQPFFDTGDITSSLLPTPSRIDSWIRTGVHVKGRPNWVFVRLHTHGTSPKDQETLLGPWLRQMHRYLGNNYNDGDRYVLHYVTAREAYNIAKAAESGKTGDPQEYRDYLVPRPFNSRLMVSCPYQPISATEEEIQIRLLCSPGEIVTLQIRWDNIQVVGDVQNVSVISMQGDSRVSLQSSGPGILTLRNQRHDSYDEGDFCCNRSQNE